MFNSLPSGSPSLAPLISNGFPNQLPLRGPLDLPTPAVSPVEIDLLLEENSQLILLAEEEIGKGASAQIYLERLQRNLIYLALLSDQKMFFEEGKFDNNPVASETWTQTELDKLREACHVLGPSASPQQIANFLGSYRSIESIASVLDSWKGLRK